tara:strand:+ start:104 stop:559 length:456 start_codon:yes stop_codon:yes gene_type:complete
MTERNKIPKEYSFAQGVEEFVVADYPELYNKKEPTALARQLLRDNRFELYTAIRDGKVTNIFFFDESVEYRPDGQARRTVDRDHEFREDHYFDPLDADPGLQTDELDFTDVGVIGEPISLEDELNRFSQGTDFLLQRNGLLPEYKQPKQEY